LALLGYRWKSLAIGRGRKRKIDGENVVRKMVKRGENVVANVILRRTSADNRPTLRELRVRRDHRRWSIGVWSIRVNLGSQSSWIVRKEKNQPAYVALCRLHQDIALRVLVAMECATECNVMLPLAATPMHDYPATDTMKSCRPV